MRLLAYKDAKFGWRWKIVASNGKIVCASSEAFTSLAKCRKNARLTEDALWEHVNPFDAIEFTNEESLKKGKK